MTCFTGVNQYHCLRVEGDTGPAHLSSAHIRSTDFECMALPDSNLPDQKGEFTKNTHTLAIRALTYLASIDLAWGVEPNHTRISASSEYYLQCTRADAGKLATIDLSPETSVVTLIMDMTTDKSHFHFVKGGEPTEAHAQAVMSALEDNEPGHVVDPKTVALHAQMLAGRVAKDLIPHNTLASWLGPFAARCAGAHKELHLILTGCNTQNVCGALKKVVREDCQAKVWVLCTSDLWPSDLATFLWHFYGSLAQPGDLQLFRVATRRLLGEYTDHYKRQCIVDESMREARGGVSSDQLSESLADAVYLDRLDRIKVEAGGEVSMQLL